MAQHSAAVLNSPHETRKQSFKVADAVWIATALWHRECPERDRFSTEEIVDKVMNSHLTEGTKRSVWQHVNQHCVANRDPNPNRVRMLFALGKGDRRLFRIGDSYSSGREGSPTHPEWSVLGEYRDLQRWYEQEWNAATEDPLLALVGSGKHLWKDESGDQFLARLRSNWGGMQ